MTMHLRGQVHYLELKAPKGVLSRNQLVFQEECWIDGIPYHVIKTLEDIRGVVE